MIMASDAVAGGALGNACDRIVYGAVADYINVSCCTIDHPYSFNVADVLIFGGAIFLVLSREVFQHDRPETDVSELRDNV
jgi:signal peptidase II